MDDKNFVNQASPSQNTQTSRKTQKQFALLGSFQPAVAYDEQELLKSQGAPSKRASQLQHAGKEAKVLRHPAHEDLG